MKIRTRLRPRLFIAVLALSTAASVLASCGKSWRTDYGAPAAQFEAKDVLAKGAPFIGKKVTVKGTVARADLTRPGAATVYLTDGIICNFGRMEAMAKSVTSGQTVFIDGILAKCEPGGVVIDPAILRDPSAPYQQ